MSVMVAIKDKNRIVVGVDVRMSGGEGYVDSYSRRPKAIHLTDKKDIIIGAVGNIGLLDVLKEQLLGYDLKALYSIDKSFLVKYVIPALAVSMRDFEMRDKEGRLDGELLIAIKDRAYLITGNLTVEEIVKYDAEGSGRDAALGSLYTSSSLFSMTPESKIKMAIESAGSCVSSVSKLAYIGDTAGKAFLPTNLKNPQ